MLNCFASTQKFATYPETSKYFLKEGRVQCVWRRGGIVQIRSGVRDLEFIRKQSILVYQETLGKIHGSSNVKTFIACTKRNNDLSDPNLYISFQRKRGF